MQDKERLFVVTVVNIGLNDPRDGFLPQDVLVCKTSTTWAGAEEVARLHSPEAVRELDYKDAAIIGGRLLQYRIRERETAEEVYHEMVEAAKQREFLLEEYLLNLSGE